MATGIQITTSVPERMITREEYHQLYGSSTPASFRDIPPVIYHRQENVSITFDPPLPGFELEDSDDGSIIVLESYLLYFSSKTGKGFQVPYPAITLHAISRSSDKPSIYCQIEEPNSAENGVETSLPTAPATNGDAAQEEDGKDEEGGEEEAEEDVGSMREMHIIPAQLDSLDAIFEALSACAQLHPDPNVSDDDMMDAAMGDGLNDEEGLSEAGRAMLARFNALLLSDDDDDDSEGYEAYVDADEGEADTSGNADVKQSAESTKRDKESAVESTQSKLKQKES